VRVAGIDMGSNTTRLIVADVTRDAAGALSHIVLTRRTTITRLAQDVDRRGILLPEAITRTRNALVDYRSELRAAGAVFALATATSAVRDADNGEAFLGEVEHGFGFTARLLDGGEEAQTTWAGVTSDPGLATRTGSGTGLLLDIGGGSTEVLLTSEGAVVENHSFQLGSVRLTEQYLAGTGPIPKQSLVRARARVQELFAERFPNAAPPGVAIGVAGTITTVVSIVSGHEQWQPALVHGAHVTPDEVDELIERLAVMPTDARRRITGLEPDRAPVIVGGLVILAEALRHFGIERMVVSVRDILDGVALEAGRVALEQGITELHEPFGRTVC